MHRLLTALVLCLSTAALADLTMVSETTAMGKTRNVTLSAKGGKAYFEMKEGDGGPTITMLRDADAKKMFLIDHPKKVVMVMTEEDSKALEAKQAEFRAQMKAQLEKLPPEKRARFEATMLGGVTADGKAPVFTYEKKKTPARKVSGFTCQDYTINRDGKPHGEGCFMTWKEAGFSADEFKAIMVRAMPNSMNAGPMGAAFDAAANAPGFPAYRKVIDDAGNVTSETTVKSISKTAVAASNFELPKDYEQKSMAGAMPRGPAPTTK